jgi:hypothetical protein
VNHALLADCVAGIHLGIVAFIIFGQLAVFVGWPLGWRWVRSLAFRLTHLGVMLYIVQNAVRGKYCFLTHWEGDLRAKAGQEGSDGSFIGRLLHDILFVDIPQDTLNTYYLIFFGAVLFSWWAVKPRWRRRPR